MRERVRAGAATTLFMVAPALAILLLHHLGRQSWLQVDWSDLSTWISTSPIEDALASILRLVALAGSYWLAGSTFLYLLARLTGVGALIEVAARFTLPIVRRLSDRVVVGSITLSTLAAPMAALSTVSDSPPTPAAAVTDVSPPDTMPLEPPDRPAIPYAPPPYRRMQAPTIPEPPEQLHSPGAIRLEVVVRSGDHLWGLAERRMAETLGRPPEEHEIAPYWRVVVDANRSRLRSGDPDLIYPGEVILLPAIDATGG